MEEPNPHKNIRAMVSGDMGAPLIFLLAYTCRGKTCCQIGDSFKPNQGKVCNPWAYRAQYMSLCFATDVTFAVRSLQSVECDVGKGICGKTLMVGTSSMHPSESHNHDGFRDVSH
jgi:hypothetical protein